MLLSIFDVSLYFLPIFKQVNSLTLPGCRIPCHNFLTIAQGGTIKTGTLHSTLTTRFGNVSLSLSLFNYNNTNKPPRLSFSLLFARKHPHKTPTPTLIHMHTLPLNSYTHALISRQSSASFIHV